MNFRRIKIGRPSLSKSWTTTSRRRRTWSQLSKRASKRPSSKSSSCTSSSPQMAKSTKPRSKHSSNRKKAWKSAQLSSKPGFRKLTSDMSSQKEGTLLHQRESSISNQATSEVRRTDSPIRRASPGKTTIHPAKILRKSETTQWALPVITITMRVVATSSMRSIKVMGIGRGTRHMPSCTWQKIWRISTRSSRRERWMSWTSYAG